MTPDIIAYAYVYFGFCALIVGLILAPAIGGYGKHIQRDEPPAPEPVNVPGQSKADSLREVACNMAVGMVGYGLIVYGVFTEASLSNGTKVTLVVGLCSAWSIVRGYLLRRLFNQRMKEAQTK